jgi:gliding motility-associated-like protein
MKKLNPSFFCCLIALLSLIPAIGQEPYCQNLGFELGNFTNWVGYTWRYSTDVTSINSAKVQGIVNRRQTIMSDTTAYDANTGNALRKIPTGYLYSARLGDEIISSDANPRCWQQSLRYTMTIDSSNALLIMKFACVLQYATDHTAKVEPRFRLTLYDKSGNTIPDCSNYDVYSSNSYVKGFKTYTPAGTNSQGTNSPVEWRDWTTVGADLMQYIGQTITLEFMATDCTGRYHYGYAYFVAKCLPMRITVKYCAGDSVAKLTAPEGFEKYSWTNSSGTVIDTSQILQEKDPIEGAKYTCTMTSATGCTVSLQSTISKYILKTDFSSYMIDCKSNKVQLTNSSTTTHGSLLYKWNFGDGTSTEKNPRYTFTTSGMHQVTLSLTNPPSTCVDTLTKMVESFSPPLIGISGYSTYCPNLSVFLKAYGAYEYTWSSGSKVDSIEVSAPGGQYWLVGHSSTGCISDTSYRKVSEEPDWKFLTDGDTTLCKGAKSLLTTSGAVHYLWSTGDTTNSITVTTAGIYTGTGENLRGCKKSRTYNVVEYPIPLVDFTLSVSSVNSKHNGLTGNIPAQADVQYVWNMGDGTTEMGSDIQHTYAITNAVLGYIVVLTATSKYSCLDSAYKTVDVVPFIPNVFSPNGDGINDVFMSNIELQVFDRSGTILYKGSRGWNGRHKGRIVDPDTYFYVIHYTDMHQHVQIKKGYVTLVSEMNLLK